MSWTFNTILYMLSTVTGEHDKRDLPYMLQNYYSPIQIQSYADDTNVNIKRPITHNSYELFISGNYTQRLYFVLIVFYSLIKVKVHTWRSDIDTLLAWPVTFDGIGRTPLLCSHLQWENTANMSFNRHAAWATHSQLASTRYSSQLSRQRQ